MSVELITSLAGSIILLASNVWVGISLSKQIKAQKQTIDALTQTISAIDVSKIKEAKDLWESFINESIEVNSQTTISRMINNGEIAKIAEDMFRNRNVDLMQFALNEAMKLPEKERRPFIFNNFLHHAVILIQRMDELNKSNNAPS